MSNVQEYEESHAHRVVRSDDRIPDEEIIGALSEPASRLVEVAREKAHEPPQPTPVEVSVQWKWGATPTDTEDGEDTYTCDLTGVTFTKVDGKVPMLTVEYREAGFDGTDTVQFIIEPALAEDEEKLRERLRKRSADLLIRAAAQARKASTLQNAADLLES